MRLSSWVVLLALAATAASLSKSDKYRAVEKDQSTKEDKPELKKTTKKRGTARFPPNSITPENILKEHDQTDTGPALFDMPKLAYITPWNRDGYHRVVEVAHKLTHVSPVWFQVKPKKNKESIECELHGLHEINKEYMASLREKNTNLKIIPRIVFEKFSGPQLQSLIASESIARTCIAPIIRTFQDHGFDGVVLDVYMYLMQNAGNQATSVLELLVDWGRMFQNEQFVVVLPIHPPVQPTEQFGVHKLRKVDFSRFTEMLTQSIDYLQVMSYDYSGATSKQELSVAPLVWVEENIKAMIGETPELASKILIGMNFYGYEVSLENTYAREAIKFDKYLQLLEESAGEVPLTWIDESEEHLMTIRGLSQVVFPTLTSIEKRILLAQDYGVGVAFWEFGQGLPYFSRLL